MRFLLKFYDKSLSWSQHAHAPRYLAAVSFVDASVFPIPPFFMLAPMALARPNKAYQYALIATVASVLGGILGYLLGYLVFKPVALPLIEFFGYSTAYANALELFQERGFVAILLAGFTPLPFKIIAIGAGFVQAPIVAFLVASIVSRGVKFFAVALLIKAGGDKMAQRVRVMLEKLGVVSLGIVAIIFGLRFFKVF